MCVSAPLEPEKIRHRRRRVPSRKAYFAAEEARGWVSKEAKERGGTCPGGRGTGIPGSDSTGCPRWIFGALPGSGVRVRACVGVWCATTPRDSRHRDRSNPRGKVLPARPV